MAASSAPLGRKSPMTTQGTTLPSDTAAENLRRYKVLVARTIEVFGDPIRANLWLSSPSTDFDGKTPAQVAQEHSYRLEALEPELTRIEHGIYF
jgi:uncharacterized protein (DUF2384 family)